MFSRESAFEETRKRLREAHAERDLLLIHTVHSISELDHITNLLVERLREWYGLHFPELDVADPEAYCKIVLMFDRSNLEKSTLAEIVTPEQADAILIVAKNSTGSDFAEEDMKAVREFATQITNLYMVRAEIDAYQTELTKLLAPNLSTIVEPALAAKLIAQAGGIKKLALFPASTIQVLGAEKALFKHLRKGSLPPKHGLLFQDPAVGNAPSSHRGKLARIISTKLAIASKADAFSHNFIAGKLKEKLNQRISDIAKIPVREKAPAPIFRDMKQRGPKFGGRPFKSQWDEERPRPSSGGEGREGFRPRSERPSYGGRPSGDRPRFGGRPSFGGRSDDRPRRSFGERSERPSYGGAREERPRFGGDRRPAYGDRPRPSYNARPSFGGERSERPSFGGDRPRPAYGSRPSFGDRPRPSGDRPSYGSESDRRDSKPRFQSGGDRPRPFSKPKPREDGEGPRRFGQKKNFKKKW